MQLALITAVGLTIGCALGPSASGQVPAGLDIQSYAGLTISGGVGAVYLIEYVTDLDQTNNPSAWRCLDYLQLPTNFYVWADKSAPEVAKRFYRAVVMTAPTNMVFIPPGTFRMGSPSNEVGRIGWEGPQTAVTIGRGFWMGKYEVTQDEYLQVTHDSPSYFSGDYNRPVEQVNWFDATNYCALLTERERTAGRIATNSVYRLPTEAEWEYACRAWTSDRQFSYGDDRGYTNLENYAWYQVNSGSTTHAVGQKSPNPWGLYDMHGNVSEWCQDLWLDHLPGGLQTDPEGPKTVAGSIRVFRGGAWNAGAQFCRSGERNRYSPGSRFFDIGFRVVLVPGRP